MVPTGFKERKRTKEEAADELSRLLGRSGIPASPEQLLEMFAANWSKLSMLSHAIHNDWRPKLTAMDAAGRYGGQPQ